MPRSTRHLKEEKNTAWPWPRVIDVSGEPVVDSATLVSGSEAISQSDLYRSQTANFADTLFHVQPVDDLLLGRVGLIGVIGSTRVAVASSILAESVGD